MNRAEISGQLWNLSIQASVALAVRFGLRLLPWLALSEEKQALMSWPESDRAKLYLMKSNRPIRV